MQLYPAIDLKDGQCVRLVQGDYNQVTVYGEEPVAIAKKWVDLGASYLHLVDLDGAKGDYGKNKAVIQQIVKAIPIPVQLGGGIRSIATMREMLRLGVARVILGSAAVKNRGLVKEAIDCFGADRIVIGVDVKKGKVAIEGWLEITALDAVAFCLELKQLGVEIVIYTDIAKDGMMEGPSIVQTARLIKETGLKIIASGGVSSLGDLERVENTGAQGVIIGKALYTGAISLEEALRDFEKGGV